MNITIVAGARPNFMKIAPVIKSIKKFQKTEKQLRYRLVHTGQHYDASLSKVFFEELGIPNPDTNLGVGSGSHATQTAKIMMEFEKELQKHPADCVIVVGDVNSTMACTIVAKKMHTRVAHIEAGIRSFDLDMPEEINRMVTDSITDFAFTTSKYANQNLIKAGFDRDRIFFVGNTMIDTLMSQLDSLTRPAIWEKEQLEKKKYIVLTLHRPSNVDDPGNFKNILETISSSVSGRKIIFPVHPRTQRAFDQITVPENLVTVDPMPYLQFIYLVRHSLGVVTDSGGIQEETTVMDIPCITLRNSTERPETVDVGTNILLKPEDIDQLPGLLKKMSENGWQMGQVPDLWDGKTSDRIVRHLLELHE